MGAYSSSPPSWLEAPFLLAARTSPMLLLGSLVRPLRCYQDKAYPYVSWSLSWRYLREERDPALVIDPGRELHQVSQ